MPSKSILISVVVVVLLLVVGGGYIISSSTNAGKAVEVGITIMGDDMDHYSPANVTVREGQSVTLAVFNDADVTHGLVLPAFNVDTGIIPSKHTIRASFLADKVGTFSFNSPASHCSGRAVNACDNQQGLDGTLTVLP
jgi:heme/copper-type cytochrome/quinol oxidase subunit 2